MRWFAYLLLAIGCALAIIGQIAIRIANPDMSETRLFVNFWWYWLITLTVCFLGLALSSKVERDDLSS